MATRNPGPSTPPAAHGGPRPTAAAGPSLPPASASAVEQMEAEVLRDKEKRSCSIDPDRLRPAHLTIRQALDVDRRVLRATAPDLLPGFLFFFDRAFTDFEDAHKAISAAVPGQRVYSKATRTLAKDIVWPLFKEIRDRSGDRLAHVPGAEDVRARLGVNSGISADAPQDILTGVEAQQQLLSEARWRPMLEAAGLFPDVWLERLDTLVPQLTDAIHAGTAGEVKLGTALGDQNVALLELDVVVSRAAAFLSAFGSPALAEALEKAVPRKSFKPGDPGGSGGDGSGGGNGGGDPPPASGGTSTTPAASGGTSTTPATTGGTSTTPATSGGTPTSPATANDKAETT